MTSTTSIYYNVTNYHVPRYYGVTNPICYDVTNPIYYEVTNPANLTLLILSTITSLNPLL